MQLTKHVIWRTRWALGLGCALMLTLAQGWSPFSVHAVTLQAGVEQTFSGPMVIVVDSESKSPLGGASVQLPELGWQKPVAPDGRVALPATVQGRNFLIGVVCGNREPRTLHIPATAQFPLIIALRPTVKSWTISNTYFRLGDGSYSMLSAGAAQLSSGQWHLAETRPEQDVSCPYPPSVLAALRQGRPFWLTLGSVVGLDTQASQAAGQSSAPVAASALQVIVNGRLVQALSLNGDEVRVDLPPGLLAGRRVINIRLKAGYHLKNGEVVDYDDAGVLHLVLHWR